MNLNDLHRRLLQDVLAIGNTFPFVITGGYIASLRTWARGWSDDISRRLHLDGAEFNES